MSDYKPCEVHDIGVKAFGYLFPEKIECVTVGDYVAVCVYVRKGYVKSSSMYLFGNGCSLDSLLKTVEYLYKHDLDLLDLDVPVVGDYEIWHIVEDGEISRSVEVGDTFHFDDSLSYWAAGYDYVTLNEGNFYEESGWLPAFYVWFETEELAQMFAYRVCGYPFKLTAVGYMDSEYKKIHIYESHVTPSGRKCVKVVK